MSKSLDSQTKGTIKRKFSKSDKPNTAINIPIKAYPTQTKQPAETVRKMKSAVSEITSHKSAKAAKNARTESTKKPRNRRESETFNLIYQSPQSLHVSFENVRGKEAEKMDKKQEIELSSSSVSLNVPKSSGAEEISERSSEDTQENDEESCCENNTEGATILNLFSSRPSYDVLDDKKHETPSVDIVSHKLEPGIEQQSESGSEENDSQENLVDVTIKPPSNCKCQPMTKTRSLSKCGRKQFGMPLDKAPRYDFSNLSKPKALSPVNRFRPAAKEKKQKNAMSTPVELNNRFESPRNNQRIPSNESVQTKISENAFHPRPRISRTVLRTPRSFWKPPKSNLPLVQIKTYPENYKPTIQSEINSEAKATIGNTANKGTELKVGKIAEEHQKTFGLKRIGLGESAGIIKMTKASKTKTKDNKSIKKTPVVEVYKKPSCAKLGFDESAAIKRFLKNQKKFSHKKHKMKNTGVKTDPNITLLHEILKANDNRIKECVNHFESEKKRKFDKLWNDMGEGAIGNLQCCAKEDSLEIDAIEIGAKTKKLEHILHKGANITDLLDASPRVKSSIVDPVRVSSLKIARGGSGTTTLPTSEIKSYVDFPRTPTPNPNPSPGERVSVEPNRISCSTSVEDVTKKNVETITMVDSAAKYSQTDEEITELKISGKNKTTPESIMSRIHKADKLLPNRIVENKQFCLKCQTNVKTDEQSHVVCSLCCRIYHEKCSGLSEVVFMELVNCAQLDWLCFRCKDLAQSPENPKKMSVETLNESLNELHQTVESMVERMDILKSTFSQQTKVRDKLIGENLRINNAISSISSKVKDLAEANEVLVNHNQSLKQKLVDMKKQGNKMVMIVDGDDSDLKPTFLRDY